MSALMHETNYKENLRAFKIYISEVKIRENALARKSAKRMVVEYAELLMVDPLFKELHTETRSEISSSFFKNKVELMLEDEEL